jgi:hypothetical protein
MLKKIVILFALLSLTLAGLFVYLFEPYMELDRERISSDPIEIEVAYVNITGEPACAKLYKLDTSGKQRPEITKTPVFIYLPRGLPSPEDDSYAYADNKFTIKGYEYKWVEKNIITGKELESPAERFDVVSWRVHPPYKFWASLKSSDQTPNVKISTDPVEHTFQSSEHNPEYFVGQNSIDCMK